MPRPYRRRDPIARGVREFRSSRGVSEARASKLSLWALFENTGKILKTALANSKRVQVKQVVFNTFSNMASVYSARCRSDNGESYAATIAFRTLRGSAGGEGNVPSANRDPVLVRCECKSYLFWFAPANQKAGCQYGENFPAYRRKTTDTKRYPEKNPGKVPGMCKHLIRMMHVLIQRGDLEMN